MRFTRTAAMLSLAAALLTLPTAPALATEADDAIQQRIDQVLERLSRWRANCHERSLLEWRRRDSHSGLRRTSESRSRELPNWLALRLQRVRSAREQDDIRNMRDIICRPARTPGSLHCKRPQRGRSRIQQHWRCWIRVCERLGRRQLGNVEGRLLAQSALVASQRSPLCPRSTSDRPGDASASRTHVLSPKAGRIVIQAHASSADIGLRAIGPHLERGIASSGDAETARNLSEVRAVSHSLTGFS